MSLFTEHELELLRLGDAAEDYGEGKDRKIIRRGDRKAHPGKPTTRTKVLKYVRENGIVTPKQVAQALGMRRRYTGFCLANYYYMGYLRRPGYGQYTIAEES